MSDWKKISLGNLIEIKHGFAFKGEFISENPNENILITPGNFNIGGGFKSDKLKYYFGEIPENYILSSEDIIITMTDLSVKTDTLGYSAMIPKSDSFFLHNQRIGLVRLISHSLNKYWLYWKLRTRHYQRSIANTATGTTVKHTSPKLIYEYILDLPPLPEQKSIAAILSSLDDKIENLRQQNQTLEKIAQTLFKHWFVDFEFPNEHNKPYKSSGGKMIDSELGPIPEGWRFVNESNEINIAYGKNLPTKNLLNEGYTVFGANGLIGYFKSYHYKYPQVLISCRGEASGKVNFSLPYSFVTNNSLVLEIQPDSQLSYVYLKYYCLKHNFLPYVTGSAQPQITIESLRSFLILMPCNQILSLFNIFAESIENKMSLNNNQIQTLTKTRDTLLPKLMSGEIRMN